jgi:biopolymer transport protein TolQ
MALKVLQLWRRGRLEEAMQSEAATATDASDLLAIARQHPRAPSSRVLASIRHRPTDSTPARFAAASERALVAEREDAAALLTSLATIGSTAPFIGLFGTVYGIIDAFGRIAAEQSASLTTVAPAIGEALFTTALGLVTAIPAAAGYNALERAVDRHLVRLDGAVAEWLAIVTAVRVSRVSDARRSPNAVDVPVAAASGRG